MRVIVQVVGTATLKNSNLPALTGYADSPIVNVREILTAKGEAAVSTGLVKATAEMLREQPDTKGYFFQQVRNDKGEVVIMLPLNGRSVRSLRNHIEDFKAEGVYLLEIKEGKNSAIFALPFPEGLEWSIRTAEILLL